MATITKKAFQSLQLTASAATLYTCPANTRASFKKLTVSNSDTVNRSVTFYLVTAAGTADATNIITVSQTVTPNQALDIYEIEGHSIGALDFLQGKADVTLKVTVHCTVVEMTV